MNSRTIMGAIALVGLGNAGCSGTTSQPEGSRFTIEFQVTNDDGDALASAAITAGKWRLGTSGPGGVLKAELSGAEGQTLPILLECPDGFTGPDRPAQLRLTHTRRLNLNGYQPMHYEAVCQRNVRDIVLVVRAQGGAGLSLQIDGKPAGITDADGIAHVLVRAERNLKSLNVSLDTSAHQELKPKNPSRTYELAGNDAVLVFDQALVATHKPVSHGASTKPRKHIPYRVD